MQIVQQGNMILNFLILAYSDVVYADVVIPQKEKLNQVEKNIYTTIVQVRAKLKLAKRILI